jgi:hypothetical protein
MVSPGKQTRCLGCRAVVPDMDGPHGPFNLASPGCWAIYGEVLAREYGEYHFPPVHRMTLDSYALQHPGRPSLKAVHSIALHLTSLYFMLERGFDADQTTEPVRRLLLRRQGFLWLDPPTELGPLTILDIHGAGDLAVHTQRVRDWAEGVWQSWALHHDTVRSWAESIA